MNEVKLIGVVVDPPEYMGYTNQYRFTINTVTDNQFIEIRDKKNSLRTLKRGDHVCVTGRLRSDCLLDEILNMYVELQKGYRIT